MSKYQELLNLNNKIQRLMNEDEEEVNWELKYDLIFSEEVSRKVFSLIREIGTSLEYYDPDSSYEEDLRAFSEALAYKIVELEKINYMFEGK